MYLLPSLSGHQYAFAGTPGAREASRAIRSSRLSSWAIKQGRYRGWLRRGEERGGGELESGEVAVNKFRELGRKLEALDGLMLGPDGA